MLNIKIIEAKIPTMRKLGLNYIMLNIKANATANPNALLDTCLNYIILNIKKVSVSYYAKGGIGLNYIILNIKMIHVTIKKVIQ